MLEQVRSDHVPGTSCQFPLNYFGDNRTFVLIWNALLPPLRPAPSIAVTSIVGVPPSLTLAGAQAGVDCFTPAGAIQPGRRLQGPQQHLPLGSAEGQRNRPGQEATFDGGEVQSNALPQPAFED